MWRLKVLALLGLISSGNSEAVASTLITNDTSEVPLYLVNAAVVEGDTNGDGEFDDIEFNAMMNSIALLNNVRLVFDSLRGNRPRVRVQQVLDFFKETKYTDDQTVTLRAIRVEATRLLSKSLEIKPRFEE